MFSLDIYVCYFSSDIQENKSSRLNAVAALAAPSVLLTENNFVKPVDGVCPTVLEEPVTVRQQVCPFYSSSMVILQSMLTG